MSIRNLLVFMITAACFHVEAGSQGASLKQAIEKNIDEHVRYSYLTDDGSWRIVLRKLHRNVLHVTVVDTYKGEDLTRLVLKCHSPTKCWGPKEGGSSLYNSNRILLNGSNISVSAVFAVFHAKRDPDSYMPSPQEKEVLSRDLDRLLDFGGTQERETVRTAELNNKDLLVICTLRKTADTSLTLDCDHVEGDLRPFQIEFSCSRVGECSNLKGRHKLRFNSLTRDPEDFELELQIEGKKESMFLPLLLS